MSAFEPALRVQGLSYSFGRRKVLEHIGFQLEPGIFAVTGHNGSGKSTLLRLLATVLTPPKDSIFLHGMDLSVRQERHHARKAISFLPQTTRLDSRLRVCDWLDFGGWLQALGTNERQARIAESAGQWHLQDLMRLRMRSLSVGQRRRVDLARACLRMDATVMVLDEPFAALDPPTVSTCQEILVERSHRSVVIYADPVVTWDQASVAVDLAPLRAL